MKNEKKKPKKKSTALGKIQMIEWLDHTATNGSWQPDHTVPALLNNTSIGRVVHEDAESVVLERDWCEENNSNGALINIIKSCIKRRRTLR